MSNKEFAELLDYITEKTNELENVTVYRVHSSYDPSNNKFTKISLKINYTKDGSELPVILNGKLPKNVVERSVNFRSSECNKENIIEWLDEFIDEKRK